MPMHIADKVTDLIGNTPLLRLNRLGAGIDGTVVVKLEFFSPGAQREGPYRRAAMLDAAAGRRQDQAGHHHSRAHLREYRHRPGDGLRGPRHTSAAFVMPETMSRERKPAAQGLWCRPGPHPRARWHARRDPPRR
jgi:cysteine synthase A